MRKEKRMWKAWMEELHGKRKSLFGFEGTAKEAEPDDPR